MSLLDKFSLRGKNALISSPEYVYGPEIAIGLAEAGANVWLCGECTKSLDEVAAQMEKAGYKAAGKIEYHQGTAESAVELADKVRKELKTLDIFVENGNNVPTTGWARDDFNTINDLFQRLQTGFILTVQQLGIIMSDQGFGSVILVTDIHGLVGCDIHNYDNAPEMFDKAFSYEYGYIKGSYVNYTKQAAGFLGKYTARCNCLAYGPLEGNDPKAFGDAIIRHSHIKRLAQADDVKAAAVFLASDASSFITGQTIAVDGGYTVK